MAERQRPAAESGVQRGGGPTRSWRLFPRFLACREAQALFDELRRSVSWQQETIVMFGRAAPVPRLVAWYGDAGLNYRYSGNDHHCAGWPETLRALCRRVSACSGFESNFVLLNRYRDGRDYMGWHRDDERGLGAEIASLSLGAERRFLVEDPVCAATATLTLGHGALLVMPGTLRHCLPKTRRPVEERINLTFRRLRQIR
ncbi:MAG: alpha-ketoglutarate-dependent dioxygenase AlkB [Pseudomonadales bacterium]